MNIRKRNTYLIKVLSLILFAFFSLGIANYLLPAGKRFYKGKAVNETNVIGKIVIREGKLVNSLDNSPFIVRSNQYIKTGRIPGNILQIITFSPEQYSRQEVANAFSKMKELGYNTTRIIFNNQWDTKPWSATRSCREGGSYSFEGCLNIQGVNNLAETINIAGENGLKVILTFVGWLPGSYFSANNISSYSGRNIAFLNEQTAKDMGRYYYDFFNYLKGRVSLDNILAVEPLAEPSIDGDKYPFSVNGLTISYPEFNVEQGKSYQVNGTLLTKVHGGQSSALMKEIINYTFLKSFNYWYEQIKRADPGILTLYDHFFEHEIKTEAGRQTNDLVVINKRNKADIIAFQIYPNKQAGLEYFEKITNFNPHLHNLLDQRVKEKPFLVIEFGYWKDGDNASNHVNFLKQWLALTCEYQPQGWSFFNWSATVANNFTAVENNYLIATELSPQRLPNPCLR